MDWTKRINELVGKDFYIHKDHPDVKDFIDYLYAPDSEEDLEVFRDMPEFGEPLFDKYTKVLYKIANYIKPKVAVELGVRQGRSSLSYLKVLEQIGGVLHSFDPVRASDVMLNENEPNWRFYEMKGEEGYEKYGDQIGKIDMLYTDVDPHHLSDSLYHISFQNGWMRNIRPSGHLILDDVAPQYQSAVRSIDYEGVQRIVRDYGTVQAMLILLDEHYNKIDYCFTVFNNHCNGFAIIRLKEV
jgi:hypothetical protein